MGFIEVEPRVGGGLGLPGLVMRDDGVVGVVQVQGHGDRIIPWSKDPVLIAGSTCRSGKEQPRLRDKEVGQGPFGSRQRRAQCVAYGTRRTGSRNEVVAPDMSTTLTDEGRAYPTRRIVTSATTGQRDSCPSFAFCSLPAIR